MEQEKLYVIEEKTYEAHIDEEVHLYGLLHQLAFLAGKIKDREDVEAFIAAAKRYGQIADSVTVCIVKALRVNLIGNLILPPFSFHMYILL